LSSRIVRSLDRIFFSIKGAEIARRKGVYTDGAAEGTRRDADEPRSPVIREARFSCSMPAFDLYVIVRLAGPARRGLYLAIAGQRSAQRKNLTTLRANGCPI
jgi:hypothetical protein